ncbi:MAG: peptidylprolyl isomerase [Actinobacteria bacterium]|nr:peptidylprolyl isomerase [Actinomycetota bacterium]
MEATRGAVVTFTYTLTSDEGRLLSEAGDRIEYLHGYGNIIPGLEKALEGMSPGDRRSVAVEPEDAYGQHDPDGVMNLSRDLSMADMDLAPGMRVIGETENGPVTLVVREVNADSIVVDANHPLAGMRLHFDVEIVDVRPASEEELAQGCAG